MRIINIADEVKKFVKDYYGATSADTVYDPSFSVTKVKVTPQFNTIDTSPTNNFVSSQSISNSSDVEQSKEVTFSKNTTRTDSSAVTQGVKAGVTISTKESFKFGFVSSDVTLTVSAEYNYSTTETTTKTETQSWQDKVTLKAPPHTYVKADYIIQEGKYNVPVNVECDFEGTINFIAYRDGATIATGYITVADLADYNNDLNLVNIGGGRAHFKGEGYIEGAQGLQSMVQISQEPLNARGLPPRHELIILSYAENVSPIKYPEDD